MLKNAREDFQDSLKYIKKKENVNKTSNKPKV